MIETVLTLMGIGSLIAALVGLVVIIFRIGKSMYSEGED